METAELLVVERSYCDDASKLSVGLANIHAAVPDVEANKDNLVAAEQPERFLNRTFALGRDADYLADENTYDKVFLPGIEKDYTESGRDDRLVPGTRHGRLGFTTCYDYLFSELLREYSMVAEVDAIVQVASWRAAGRRDYPRMNQRTDHYYGDLWDSVMAASSATNQVWTIACGTFTRDVS